jgi:hypothetical protein
MMSLNTTKQLIQPTQLLGLGDRGLLPYKLHSYPRSTFTTFISYQL